MTRSGARPGDEIYVTGTIGSAAAGLCQLRAGLMTDDSRLTTDDRRLVTAYLRPVPRVRMGTLLSRNRAASACVDLSDGLADGARRIAEASGIGMTVDAEALPIDPAARSVFETAGLDAVNKAITGGDDYELLVAVRPRTRRRLAAAMRHGDAPLTRVGVCTEGAAVTLRRAGVETAMPGGYSHFRA